MKAKLLFIFIGILAINTSFSQSDCGTYTRNITIEYFPPNQIIIDADDVSDLGTQPELIGSTIIYNSTNILLTGDFLNFPQIYNFTTSSPGFTQNGTFLVTIIPPGVDTDVDNDNYPCYEDCDDNNFNINPLAPEICDGIDNNCDGQIDEGCPVPSNNNCTNAIAISCNSTVMGSTYLATNTAGNTSKDVWYSFTTAAVNQDVTVSLCNSSYDTALRIYEDCSTTTQLLFNDDFCGLQSEGTFIATANTTYYILVEGFSTNSSGSYELSISCQNNNIPAPSNDNCSSPETILINTTVTGTTAGASDQSTSQDNDTTCNSFVNHADVWYTFTLNETYDGLTAITSTIGSATQASIAVYPAPMCNFLDQNSIACSANSNGGETLSLGTLSAGTYYVRVWSDGISLKTNSNKLIEGDFNLSINGTLSTTDLNNTSELFTYYPNPVTNSLSIKSQKEINTLTVYNMLGQKVLQQSPNTINSTIDMSNLQSGAYFISVQIENTTKSIRILKN